MTDTWRQNIPDLRQMAIWTLEHGQRVRAKGGREGRYYRIEVAGSCVETFIDTTVGVEEDRCQIHISDMNHKWTGALGFMVPDHLVIRSGELAEFGSSEARWHDATVYRPFTQEIMERLDRARSTKKTSPGSNQYDVSYFVYWFLIYGEQVGEARLTDPGNPTAIFDDKIRQVYDRHGMPHTYLRDPTNRFPTDFTVTKLGLS